jgi:hypothetical protein
MWRGAKECSPWSPSAQTAAVGASVGLSVGIADGARVPSRLDAVVWRMVYHVWCMVYGVWCTMCGVWCMAYGVWCIMYGVCCTAYGVSCAVHECVLYCTCRVCRRWDSGVFRRIHILWRVAHLQVIVVLLVPG